MDTFQALADPNRRKIIELIAAKGQMSSSEICNNFNVSKPAISQHLKVLRETHLVKMEKRAQRRIYRINADSIQEIGDWTHKIKLLWEKKFEKLDKLLAEMKGGDKKNG
jgi:DNA-binding transcriptional ArsR family regulator